MSALLDHRALSLDGCRHLPFIDDGLLAVHTLVGIATLNLQGCMTLTDSGLAALGHMVSLTSCNLQDCIEITGKEPRILGFFPSL